MKDYEVSKNTVSTHSFSRYTEATFRIWENIVSALGYSSDTNVNRESNAAHTYICNLLVQWGSYIRYNSCIQCDLRSYHGKCRLRSQYRQRGQCSYKVLVMWFWISKMDQMQLCFGFPWWRSSHMLIWPHGDATTCWYGQYRCAIWRYSEADTATQRYDMQPLEDLATQWYGFANMARSHWFKGVLCGLSFKHEHVYSWSYDELRSFNFF